MESTALKAVATVTAQFCHANNQLIEEFIKKENDKETLYFGIKTIEYNATLFLGIITSLQEHIDLNELLKNQPDEDSEFIKHAIRYFLIQKDSVQESFI